jgi:acyl-CoA thioester hydrolase
MFTKKHISTCDIEILPRYNETDQGGVVHHSIYPVYFEMGRTELLRANGFAYKDLEASGCAMVVAGLNIKYRGPAYYDEKIIVTTTCQRITRARIDHSYIVKDAKTGKVLTEGQTTLACIDGEGKMRSVPQFLFEMAPQ